MTSRAEEWQRWREYAQSLQHAPAGEETIATGIGIDKLLDDIESLRVALHEKTAEVRMLEEKVAALERMLHSSLRP